MIVLLITFRIGAISEHSIVRVGPDWFPSGDGHVIRHGKRNKISMDITDADEPRCGVTFVTTIQCLDLRIQ
jgi:hypothetical protein